MRSFALWGLGLLGATAAVSAADAQAETPSDVVSLTKDTFSDFLSTHELVLAEFFAPWCGHCKALAPKYEEAAKELKEKNIALVKVDCTEEEEVCKDQGVSGYPTLKVFRGPNDVKPYQGARQSEAIVSYMVKQSAPAVSDVTSGSLEDFKSMDKIAIVGYFAEDDKESAEAYTSFAKSQRDNYLFGSSNDASLASAEGVKQPSIVLYKDFDEKKATYDGALDAETLLSWVKTASTPLVGEVGPETYSGYITAGIPLAYIFAESAEERVDFAESFKPTAEKHKGAINIATIDAKAFGAHAGNLNLNPEQFPAFAIQDPTKNAKYPYDQSKKIVAKDVGKFIQDVLDGKVEPSIKSEPIPESQDGPVTVVVAHSYKELVVENEKDVLLEFYAPWCGHCKALAPKYDELAALYSKNSDLASKITIAKIDATANDVPDSITGFPTIKLFPAGSKGEPVEYSGSRTVDDLANFVKENGKHGVDAFAAQEEAMDENADKSEAGKAEASAKPEHDEL